jgi:hypothetical protein
MLDTRPLRRSLGTLLSVVFLAACAVPADDADVELDTAAYTSIVAEGTPEAKGVLLVVNTLSFEDLDAPTRDGGVGLDVRAARNIVARRAGADGIDGTADDAPFETIAQLQAVPWVATKALQSLLAYAKANGHVSPPPPPSKVIPPGAVSLRGSTSVPIETRAWRHGPCPYPAPRLSSATINLTMIGTSPAGIMMALAGRTPRPLRADGGFYVTTGNVSVTGRVVFETVDGVRTPTREILVERYLSSTSAGSGSCGAIYEFDASRRGGPRKVLLQ